MATIGNLVAVVTTNTRGLTRGLALASKKISKFSAKAGAAGRAIGGAFLPAVAGPLALVAGFGSLIKRNEELSRAMTRSLAIMGDVSDVMKKDMTQAAIEVARATQFSAKEAAEAYFFLASAGFDAAQSLAALPSVAEFAQAGNFNLALATDLLTDAQSALGLKSKDTAKNLANLVKVSDVLVKANTLANASVQQFSESLTTKAGASMRQLGISIEEGVAVLAIFADQGLKSSAAGTAYSIVLRDLTTKAIKNEEAFKKANIAVFDSQGELRNMADIVRDLDAALAGMSDKQKKATLLQLGFADRSVVFIQSLLGMGDAIAEYEEKLNDAGGTTKQVSDDSLTPMQKALANLDATFTSVANSLETSFIPAIIDAAAAITSLFDASGSGTRTTRGLAFLKDIALFAFAAVNPFSDLEAASDSLTNSYGDLANTGDDVNAGLKEHKRLSEESKAQREAMIETLEEQIPLTAKAATIARLEAEEIERVAAAHDKAAESADKLIEKLQLQADTFGLNATQAALFKIGLENLTDEKLKQIRQLQEEIDLKNENKKIEDNLQRAADRVKRETLLPIEKFDKEIQLLEELLDRELIDGTEFARAVIRATDALESATKKDVAGRATDFQQVNLRRIALGGAAGVKSKKSASEDGQKRIETRLDRLASIWENGPTVRMSWN